MNPTAILAGIESALQAGDVARAATLAEAALSGGVASPMVLNLVAWAREEAGDFAAAHALLARALRQAPGDPLIRTGIGAVLRKQGLPERAVAELDGVLATQPDLLPAWLERGYALDELGQTGAAAQSFARAVRLDPACAPALAGRAVAEAREGQAAEARADAERALAIDPANVAAARALAMTAMAAGDTAGALDRIDRLLATGHLPDADRVWALTLKGDALDRLDAVDAAFAAYSAANEAYRSRHAARMDGQPTHRQFVAAIAQGLRAADPAGWPRLDIAPAPGEPPAHAFLLGYPRSGTTLTEQILASLDGVEALEERPTLGAAAEAFLLPQDGMARLAALDAAAAARLRADYWRRVAGEGGRPAASLFVDMDPLKSLHLPIIARIFPDARILLMRRDPRDIVWSCFRNSFRFSPANYAFASIEGAARHFDAVMRLVRSCTERLPLAIHEVRYEALVADFDATTRGLCDAVGLPWSPAVRAFDRTARSRAVTTASAAQVRGGLFDGGGQWRRYASHLAPALPILRPWVEAFGYAPA